MAAAANGMPTKEFFINMLTRDIALNDAKAFADLVEKAKGALKK